LGDGTLLTEAFARLRAQDAEVVGINCVNGPQAMVRLFEQISVDGHLSAFPNAGHPQFLEGRFLYSTTPEYFARSAVQLAERGARLIGGCCGIAPQHIAAMAEALKEFVPENNRP
jgi:homocysteine S-methyltransferase